MSKLHDAQVKFTGYVIQLLNKANEMGFEVTLGEVFRTVDQQKIYVRDGRSKTMLSNHMNRTAIDLNLFKDGKLCGHDEIHPLGDWWEALDPQCRWGGNWRGQVDTGRSHFIDAPHFELNSI